MEHGDEEGFRQLSQTQITAGGRDHFLYLWIRDTDQAARVTTAPVHTQRDFANLHDALGHLLSWSLAIGVIHAAERDQPPGQPTE
ncbi:MAG: hypothetical protein HOW97_03025 [Catenulispora sp.]|nr:hypothetical protein [Catenulispora sp.]